jgi:FkbM family methyltransferase
MFTKVFNKLGYVAVTVFSKIYFFKTSSGKYRSLRHRGTRADCGVIRQIFIKEEYSLRKFRRRADIDDAYHLILKQGKTPLIVDAGANIGVSVVWFMDSYPNSHIIAIEPDPDNVRLLRSNVAGLDVDIREAALGAEDGLVSLIDPGSGEWGYQTSADPNGMCPRLSITRLINEKIALDYVPFLIKIDIEGGEDNLFGASTSWVDLFPLLIIELHDWLLPGKNTSLNFIRRIGQSKRDFVYNSENVFSFRNE